MDVVGPLVYILPRLCLYNGYGNVEILCRVGTDIAEGCWLYPHGGAGW